MSIAEIADCQQSADSQTVEQLSDVCEQQVALQKNSGKVDTAHTLACKGDIAEAKRAISTQIQQTDSPNCKPYTTPDGTKSGIACKQEDGTWKIKTSQ